MASSNARRGGSAFEFLREVNENPASADEAPYALDDREISLYTNTQFFDFETGQNIDFQPQAPKPDADGQGSRSGDSNSPDAMDDFPSMEFSGPCAILSFATSPQSHESVLFFCFLSVILWSFLRRGGKCLPLEEGGVCFSYHGSMRSDLPRAPCHWNKGSMMRCAGLFFPKGPCERLNAAYKLRRRWCHTP